MPDKSDYVIDGVDYNRGKYKKGGINFLIDNIRSTDIGCAFLGNDINAIEVRKLIREKKECNNRLWLHMVLMIVSKFSDDVKATSYDLLGKRERLARIKRTKEAVMTVLYEVNDDGGVLRADNFESHSLLPFTHAFRDKNGKVIFDDAISDLMEHLLYRAECMYPFVSNRKFGGIKGENRLYNQYVKELVFQFCFDYGERFNFNKIIVLSLNVAFPSLDGRISEKEILGWVKEAKTDFFNRKMTG